MECFSGKIRHQIWKSHTNYLPTCCKTLNSLFFFFLSLPPATTPLVAGTLLRAIEISSLITGKGVSALVWAWGCWWLCCCWIWFCCWWFWVCCCLFFDSFSFLLSCFDFVFSFAASFSLLPPSFWTTSLSRWGPSLSRWGPSLSRWEPSLSRCGPSFSLDAAFSFWTVCFWDSWATVSSFCKNQNITYL